MQSDAKCTTKSPRCRECIAACKADGGWCAPLTNEEKERVRQGNLAASHRHAINEHKKKHRMHIVGNLWTCSQGHTVKAYPADVMRAMGMEPML